MALTLTKGGNITLDKEAPGLKKILIGLGWDVRATSGYDFDLDASVFLLNSNDRVSSDADFIFYNQLTGSNGAVQHMGDNRTGAGDGDDEVIKIDMTTLSPSIHKMVIAVTIHDAEIRRQNFGMVDSAYIRLVNDENDVEIVKFNLSEDASTETAMVFGELYLHHGQWKFKAVGQGYNGGLGPLARRYGVNV